MAQISYCMPINQYCYLPGCPKGKRGAKRITCICASLIASLIA